MQCWGVVSGEFAAAVAAGIFDRETGLRLVLQLAQALQICPSAGMMAIVHSPTLYESDPFLQQHFELAAVNCPMHFVVTGPHDKLALAEQRLSSKGITSQILAVSHGFHSALIDAAKIPFLQAIQETSWHTPIRPFFSCTNAKQITEVTAEHFWNAVRYPILFQQTITHLESQGPWSYVDVGPSGTLANFVKYNLAKNSTSQQFPILSLFRNSQENLQKLL